MIIHPNSRQGLHCELCFAHATRTAVDRSGTAHQLCNRHVEKFMRQEVENS